MILLTGRSHQFPTGYETNTTGNIYTRANKFFPSDEMPDDRRIPEAFFSAETAAGTAAEINMSRRSPPEAVPASSPAKSADREISYPAMRFVYR